jgi:HAD superfamily hydrolase (TIGR01509 family)
VYPGVAELVERVRGSVALGVVTVTWRANVETVLNAAGLGDDFTVIVGKEDVSKTKPDPEGYRLAVERLGVAPAEAVALEDSRSGLRAARSAGLYAVAVGHRMPHGEWAGASPFVAALCPPGDVLQVIGLG